MKYLIHTIIGIFVIFVVIFLLKMDSKFGNPKADLVKLDPEKEGFIADIKYATSDNFTGKGVYLGDFVYLHKDVYPKFKLAIKMAHKLGYKIKVFDAWRPYEAQITLWNQVPNPDYVSNPYTGPCTHCRGTAIDLTLLDKSGKELDMGTEFDSFDPKSHHDTDNLTEKQAHNRTILAGIMSRAGFISIPTEWWHFQASNWLEYKKYRAKDLDLDLVNK